MIVTYACPECARDRRVIQSSPGTRITLCSCGALMGRVLFRDEPRVEYQAGEVLRCARSERFA